MNFMAWLQIILKLTPYIVAGVETVHSDVTDGATKKKMAQDALQIATAGALSTDPNDAAITQTASQLTGMVIDSTVSDFNKTGVFKHASTASAKPAPLAAGPVIVAVEGAPQHTGAAS
jgi:hypothetical protein